MISPLTPEIESQSFPDRMAALGEGYALNNRYHINGELAPGGMAIVYDATDQFSGRDVALKVPHLGTPDIVRRFIRECQISEVVSASSEDAVSHVESGLNKDEMKPLIYLATGKLEGGTLAKRIQASRTMGMMSVEEVIKATSPAFRGVEAAHELDFVHRDIKPANIFLDPNGYGKIGDFGVAAYLPQVDDKWEFSGLTDIHANTITGCDNVVGTPAFLPPELFSEGGSYTKKGDVFAAGLTLDTAWTGELRKRMFDQYAAEPPTLDAGNMPHEVAIGRIDYPSRVPYELGQLTISCLETDPACRPTMGELAQGLREYGEAPAN